MATGAEIRALRQAAGLTQGEIAERIGMQISDFCKVEKGHRPCDALLGARMITAIDDLKRARDAEYKEAIGELGSVAEGVAK